MDKQTFTPVTFGYLRPEAKWLHLDCTVCGHEREFDVSQPPFAQMPDSTVVPTLGQSCAQSAERRRKIWSAPEFHGPSPDTLKRWRSMQRDPR